MVSRAAETSKQSEYALFHAIIEDFVLLGPHRKDSIKGESIPLRASGQLRGAHLHRL